jgi:hypothetical protein
VAPPPDVVRLRDHEGLGFQEIATQLGLTSRDAAARAYTKAKADLGAGDSDAVLASEPTDRVTSLEELLKQSKTDMTKWYVERHLINKWEVGAKMEKSELSFDKGRMNGWVNKDGLVVRPLWQIKAWLKPVGPQILAVQAVWDEMLARWEKRVVTPHAAVRRSGLYMLSLNPFDLHLGKLAYAPETGAHYDLKIAAADFRICRDELFGMTAGLPIEETLIPLGNDYFHYDNLVSTTTGGTQQDSDTRFHKMFTLGIELAIETIELAAKRSRVVVKIVPGNHDRLAAFTLGCVIEAYFRKDKRVQIDNSPMLRKYHRFGVNLLGFTHGSEEKQQDLAVIMADEAADDWAQTVHREWHIGHVHKMKGVFGDSTRGVRIRVMPSLSATDAWHASKGYKDRRAMEAYLFHKEKGYSGHFSSGVDARESAA